MKKMIFLIMMTALIIWGCSMEEPSAENGSSRSDRKDRAAPDILTAAETADGVEGDPFIITDEPEGPLRAVSSSPQSSVYDLVVTETVSGTKVFTAVNTITAKNVNLAGSSVSFTAGDRVTFSDGFRAIEGSSMQTSIETVQYVDPGPDPDGYEPDNSKETATSVVFNTIQSHTIHHNDTDYFKFTCKVEHTYQVKLLDNSEGFTCEMIYNYETVKSSKTEFLFYNDQEKRTSYLKVKNNGKYGDYQIVVYDIYPDEYDETDGDGDNNDDNTGHGGHCSFIKDGEQQVHSLHSTSSINGGTEDVDHIAPIEFSYHTVYKVNVKSLNGVPVMVRFVYYTLENTGWMEGLIKAECGTDVSMSYLNIPENDFYYIQVKGYSSWGSIWKPAIYTVEFIKD